MNRHAALLSLAAFIAFATAQAIASIPAPTSAGLKIPDTAFQTQSLKPSPPTPSKAPQGNPQHFFTVNDEKGLVLTCIAPEIDTNPDTDLFKSCHLAPGRTLDDVMHSFIHGIHYEQSLHEKDRERWLQDLEDQTAQRPTQK